MIIVSIPVVKGPLQIKVDTGSGGNALPLRTFKHLFGSLPSEQILQREPNIKLSSYTDDNIKCLGSIQLSIRRNDQNEYHCQKCYVVEVTGPAILGLPSCELLKFLSLAVDAVHKVEVGDIPNARSPTNYPTVNEDSNLPKQSNDSPKPGRRDSPEARCDTIHRSTASLLHTRMSQGAEIKKMEEFGVIHNVTRHSDCCSSLTYVVKSDGSFHVCLDPQKLNKALKRCPHKIPTVEEMQKRNTGV